MSIFRSSSMKCKIRKVLLITIVFVKNENLKYFEQLNNFRFSFFLGFHFFWILSIFSFFDFFVWKIVFFHFLLLYSVFFFFSFVFLLLFLVHSALRAPPAVTRLTVHRRLQVISSKQIHEETTSSDILRLNYSLYKSLGWRPHL